jgi:2-iminobutanoate/2-iminopropanoate deaminase
MITESRAWQPVLEGEGIVKAAGAYSAGVRAGNLLFISGQVPRDPRTGETVAGGIVEQSKQTLANVEAVLKGGGATFANLVAVTVYLANVNVWGTFNEIYKATLRPPYPTRAVVGAQLRGVLIEISGIAYIPD